MAVTLTLSEKQAFLGPMQLVEIVNLNSSAHWFPVFLPQFFFLGGGGLTKYFPEKNFVPYSAKAKNCVELWAFHGDVLI